MKRTKLFAGLACAILAAAQLGCGAFKGTTNNLQSLTLNVALINGVAPSSQANTITLEGLGGTIQLQTLGNYSDGKNIDISNKVVYNVAVANAPLDHSSYGVLLPPCTPPSCPTGSPGAYTNGTVEYDSTGLITAVQPAACTYNEDSNTLEGAYIVTASYQGFTSQPVYIPVASATEPDGSACGTAGSFSLAASPSSISVTPGSEGQTAISISPSDGFSGSVTMSASGMPSGVTATFGPNPATTTSTLTLTASSGATAGSYIITVTGVSGPVSATTTVDLTIP